jgi:DnaJ-class molecular chaperone
MNTPSSTGPVDLTQSVAGEEDPGASVDMSRADEKSAGRSDQPASQGDGKQPSGPGAPMAPGDEAPPGTPGTGEDVCPTCGGSGKLASGTCPDCQGTGKVTVGIGGA